MSDPCAAAPFPLRLTTFEKYMLLDDRADYPMAFLIQLKLSGEIVRGAFESSLEETLLRHPLLCSVVQRSARCGPVWKPADERRPRIDWNVLGASIENASGQWIDLSSEVGLRFWVRQGEGAVDVTAQFHHACCDAIGAIRFLGDLLAAYGRRTASPGYCPILRPCDLTGLARRGRFGAKSPAHRSRAGTVWAGIRDGARWFVRRPAILQPRVAASPSNATSIPFLGMHHHIFDQAQSQRIIAAARQHGVTVNDLLLRDMFQTLEQWRAGQPPEPANRWLRIAIPVNLRSGTDEQMSAANGVSYTFVTRHGNECGDPHKLLRGIREEMDAATRYRRALMFLRGVRLMERIPGAIPLYSRANRCFATVVLSNVGDVSWHFGAQSTCESGRVVAGNLILNDILGAPPVRANTRAAFMFGRYAGRLWVCVRCDPRALTADDARQLLAMYVDRVAGTMRQTE